MVTSDTSSSVCRRSFRPSQNSLSPGAVSGPETSTASTRSVVPSCVMTGASAALGKSSVAPTSCSISLRSVRMSPAGVSSATTTPTPSRASERTSAMDSTESRASMTRWQTVRSTSSAVAPG